MRQWVLMGVVAVALGGCIPPGRPQAPGGPVPIEGDSITYETGPCFGACPVYSVTVRPDGSGVFTGKRFTAVTGERGFTLTRAQYDAFAGQLAPYRPASGGVRYAPGEPNCQNAPTDMPSVDVTWTRAIGDSQHLYFYFGCGRTANPGMRDALGHAPDALPIAELIGARP
ncbi:hypothetical protein IAG41_11605 [Sphingomonas sp. JC676]|uniref:DUF6438 domain-containing protein n=1 Tax=Sphingomonas sp. JC676 TaxID=2768065 RepID=UPI001657E874|nr:DUF6438 domain-containing protein [Sphingomonas sp. JC676]MBC9033041.1 hypothetical protein [Sphingomonas sp. JC676]